MDYSAFQANYQPVDLGFSSSPKKKKGGRGGTATSLISEGAGIAGGTVGGILGSVVPIAGTAVGAAVGSGIGSFAGRLLENKVRDNRLGVGDAAKEGGLSAVLSAPLRGLKYGGTAAKALKGGGSLAEALEQGAIKADAPGIIGKIIGKGSQEVTTEAGEKVLKTSTQGKVDNLGNKLLASQYGTIGKPTARETNPLETIGKLADFGITRPQDAERIANSFTGTDGIVNKAVLKAVGKARNVETGGLMEIADAAIENGGLVDKDAKSVRNVVQAQVRRLLGGPEGSISGKADPSETLGVIKSLEKRGNDLLGKGGNYRLTTPERVDQANVLFQIRDELTDRLYGSAGADKNLAGVLTPEVREQLVKLHPGNSKWVNFIDNNVMKSQTVGDLRSTMAPFVRIGKIIDEGDVNALTFGGRLANNSSGLKDKIAGFATSTVAKPAARLSGATLKNASNSTLGEVLGGASAIGSSSALKGGFQGVKGTLREGLLSGLKTLPQGALSAPAELQPIDDVPTLQLNGEMPQSLDSALGPYDPQFAVQNAQSILSQGGDLDDVAKYIGLVQVLQDLNAPQETKLNSSQQQRATAAENAMRDIGQIEGAIGSGKLGTLKSLPGANTALGSKLLGTEDLDAALFNVADNILRARSGAATPPDEVKRFAANFLPRPTDSDAAKVAKLQRAKRELQGYLNPTRVSSNSSLEEALATLN